MDSTTKLAIGAGVGLAALVVLIVVTNKSASANPTPALPVPPVPPGTPTATSFVPGSTYEFSFIDPSNAPTAIAQNFLKAGGWQVQSISNMGAKTGGGVSGTGYVVKAVYTGTATVTPPALGDPLVLVLAVGPF